MSFWLDDDDNEDDDPYPWSSQNPKVSSSNSQNQQHESSQNKNQSQSQQQKPSTQVYQCINCDGNESYYDDATGTDVCTSCFTQSQVIASTQQQQPETDWEDVMGLAARTTGGHFKQQHKPSLAPTSTTDALGNRIIRRRRGRVKVENNDTFDDDEYDESIPLPSVQLCLQGMQCVLQKCVTIVVRDILLLKYQKFWNTNTTKLDSSTQSENDEDDYDEGSDDYYEERQREDLEDSSIRQQQVVLIETLQNTVKEIWLSYLRAWFDGAEFYGQRFQNVRFSFRDLFLSNYQVSYIVRRYIPHRIIKEKVQDESDLRMIPDTTQSTNNQNKQRNTHSSDDDEFVPNPDEVEDDDVGVEEWDDGVNDTDRITNNNRKESTTTIARKTKKKKKNSAIRLGAIQKVILQHGPRGRKRGYKEVALLLRPSMTMVAAIIHLALTKHPNNQCTDVVKTTAGLTYLDVCDWINTGKLPLMTAYHRLLTSELQQKLYAVRSFFGINDHYPIHSSQLEHMSTQLCVACRLRVQPKVVEDKNRTNSNNSVLGSDGGDNNSGIMHSPPNYPAVVQNNKSKVKGDAVRQWEMPNLPYILARFVAMAGLNQDVLDRTLQLIGYNTIATKRAKNGTVLHIPTIISADQLSRIDELFAILAIACQLDPHWRNWIYVISEGECALSIPWYDSEIRSIRNGPSFLQYLDFVNQHVLPENSNDHKHTINNSNIVSLLPPQ